MCFEKPRFMLLFETHVASEHHRPPSPIPVERTIHGAQRFGDTPRASTLHMAHRLYRLHRVMHSTRYHPSGNYQQGKGEGALHRPLRLPPSTMQ